MMMFEKYTEKASRAIFFSRREAGECGASAIDTVHLLLSLLREDDMLFESLGGMADLHTVLRVRLKSSQEKRERVPELLDIPLAEEYKDTLLLAADEARMSRSPSITPQHLLLGILHVNQSVAARILVEIGVTYDAVRDALDSKRQSGVG